MTEHEVSKRSLDAKQAVKRAIEYAQSMYADAGIKDLMLEELDTSPTGYWQVTISFLRSSDYPAGSIANMLGNKVRSYKVISVHKQTGEVTSMKMRDAQRS